MRTTLLFAFALLLVYSLPAQVVNDSVSLTPGYANQVFYSMNNGEAGSSDNTNWDLAIEAFGFSAAIRVNGSQDVQLYAHKNGDNSDFGTAIDTSGMQRLYNSDTMWSKGAGNMTADPNNLVDLGWGIYNTTTHHVTGDSMFVLRLSDGTWKQIDFVRLAGGVYEFRHADLDGSNAVTAMGDKANYTGKNFMYYSVADNMFLDREPSVPWDLVFTGYQTALAPGVWYGVTGVLSNAGVSVAEAGGLSNPNGYMDYTSHTFDNKINTIGWDWKTFSFQNGFIVDDSLAYFVSDRLGRVWRIVFTAFAGSSSGDVHFDKELIANVNADATADIQAFEMYPNPSTDGNVNIVYDIRADRAELTITDLSGRTVRRMDAPRSGFQNLYLSLNDLEAGMYIVTLTTEKQSTNRKLILR